MQVKIRVVLLDGTDRTFLGDEAYVRLMVEDGVLGIRERSGNIRVLWKLTAWPLSQVAFYEREEV